MLRFRNRLWTVLAGGFALLVGQQAHANGLLQTVYVPTETVLTVPTSYVYTSSSLLPTTYLLPTSYSYVPTGYSYFPTSYVSALPTAYYPTAYYRVRRFRPWLVERPIVTSTRAYYAAPVATSYYVTRRPVIVDEGVVTTSYVTTDCNYATAPMPKLSKPSEGSPNETSTKKPITSSSKDNRKDTSSPPGDDPLNSDPLPGTPPEPADAGGIQHTVNKPVAKAIKPKAVLEGIVTDSTSKDPEEGVRVVLMNRTKLYVDRAQKTDAKGRYAISVPDGDWTVLVTSAANKLYSVTNITVAGSQISDANGKVLDSLDIQRRPL